MRVINGSKGTDESVTGAHGEEESLGVVSPEGFDSQRAGGYSPPAFPPLRRSALGFSEIVPGLPQTWGVDFEYRF